MAITRINNNQITDAIDGNVYVGVNAAAKLQAYSITSGKISNNLTYGSDLTVTGNLTVQGNVTTIDTVNLIVEDPLILLASNQTGSPAVDIGFVGSRGTSTNIAFVWDESAGQFVTAFTTTSESNTVISIDGYTSMQVGNITSANANFTGTTTMANATIGNVVGGLNVTGTATVGNLLAGSGIISTSGNVTGGNVLFGSGVVSGTGNIAGGNLISSDLVQGVTVSASGNLVAGNANITSAVNSATVSASGDITGGNLLFGSGVVSGTGNVTAGNILTAGIVSATGNISTGNFFIGNGAFITGISSTTGTALTNGTTNITTSLNGNANVSIAGTSNVVVWASTGQYTTGVSSVTGSVIAGNVFSNELVQGVTVSASGSVIAGNVLFGSGVVSGTGNISGNIVTGTTVNATSVSASGNVLTPQITGTTVTISATGGAITLSPFGNISASGKHINNLADPVQAQDAATKEYVDSIAQGLDPKASVVYASAASIFGSGYIYNPGAAGVGATLTATSVGALTLDGDVVSAGQRVLIKNEVGAFVDNTTQSAAFNGIYVVTTAGSVGSAYVLTRATDFDNGTPSGEIPSAFTFVEFGATQADTGWVCTTNAPVTVGTTQIIFTQFSGAGTYIGGSAISINGTVINTVFDNSTIGVNGSNQLYIPANAPLTTPNIGAATGTSLSTTGTVTAASVVGGVITGTSASLSGNVTGGNVLFGSGVVSGTGNITGDVVTGTTVNATTVSASGNITGGNVLFGSGVVSGTGNVSGNVGIFTTVAATTVSASGTVTAASVVGGVITGDSTSVTGTVTAASVVGGVITGSSTSVTGTVTAASVVGGVITGTSTSVTGTVTAASVVGGVITGDSVSVTGNVTGGNVLFGTGVVSGTGNISGNVITGTTANLGNIRISVDDVTTVGSNITVNGAAANINFRVSGTAANVLAVDAASNTVIIGSLTATPVTNAALNIATTNSMIIPVGNTAQRPSVPVTGMMRYNTTQDTVEYYTANAWSTAGTDFTIITADSFVGNGVQTSYTLSTASTTAATIVAINGVVQQPTTAYAVAGTTLTFTEAPSTSDVIDVRELVTTTTVTGLQNSSGNAILQGSTVAAQFDLTGSLVPTANATANLGSVGSQFNTVFAKATSAQYADLAEMYEADQIIEAGTVVCFGGAKEITMCAVDASRRVAGVVSTNPSYLMNSGQTGEYVVPVALQGRVPVRVTGTVQKGDMMVATGDGRARAEADPIVGSVIGKALADFDGIDGVIEVVVGRV